jgi:hypothetical protein
MLPSFHGYRWCNKAGETVGYVMVSIEDKLVCSEAGGETDEILRVLGHIARRHSLHEVRFFTGLHHDHPLARKLRISTSKTEESARRCGGAMIHLINLESTLRRISGELSRRLRNSPLAQWKGNLMIARAKNKAFLHIAGSKITVSGKGSSKHSIRGGEEIAQLIIGAGDPPDTVRDAGIKVSGDARHLLPVLFPNQYPTLALWDRY